MKVLVFVIVLGLFSCKKQFLENDASAIQAIETEVSDKMTTNRITLEENQQPDRKIIWNANLRIRVENVNETTDKLKQITTRLGGFISSINLSSNTYQLSNRIELRIAHENFDKVIEEFKKQAISIDEINISSNDVSEEFVDIESRLKTKRNVRDRYIEILKTKTGSVKDIIEAEEAIRKITEEIEAKEGRLRYLKDKVKYSTITTTIYEVIEVKSSPIVRVSSFFYKSLNFSEISELSPCFNA